MITKAYFEKNNEVKVQVVPKITFLSTKNFLTPYKKLVHLVGQRAPPGSKWKGPIPSVDAPMQVVPKELLFTS